MKTLALTLIGASIVAAACAQEAPKLNDPVEETVHASSSTLDDQTSVAVTVYNAGLGLVRDRRSVRLVPGEHRLAFMDVAEQIKPETVSLRSLSDPGAIRILEQNYEYDLMSPEKLMEKYVGKEVALVNFSNEMGFSRKEATLLSTNQGPIYKVGDDIFLGHPGNVALPEIPDNLIAKPSLIWLIENGGTDHDIEVTYLTNGITWRADYVLTLARDDASMDLDAWVTLNNSSGAQYTDAQLKLVAGEVNVVRQERPRGGLQKARMLAEAAAPMQEEAFAEYHLYTLPRKTTIKNNQQKQVSLFKAAGIGTTKKYEFRGQTQYFFSPMDPQRNQHPAVFLVFQNEEENNLGVPLPGGIIRVYQEDSSGMLQFAGEDRLEHTPKDEKVRIQLGEAFDIVGERVQTDFRQPQDNRNVVEVAFRITLRNHKDSAVTVDIVEPMPGDWQVAEQSHPHEKRDAHTAVFSVEVPSDGETVVTYRLRIKRR